MKRTLLFLFLLLLCASLCALVCLPCAAETVDDTDTYQTAEPSSDGMGVGGRILICTAVGFAAALAVTLIMRYRMNTVRKKSDAADYEKPGSFRLDVSRDVFLYSRVTRVRVSSPKKKN